MSARDRYKWVLECKDCGKEGEADVSENDGWAFQNRGPGRRIDKITEGFIVVVHGGGTDGTKTILTCECAGASGVRISGPM